MVPNTPYLEMQAILPADLRPLHDQLMAKIQQIAETETDPVLSAERCVEACRQAIQQLKGLVAENPFASEREEIFFFKYVKPKFNCRLLFYQYLYRFESRKPAAAGGLTVEYVKKKLAFLGSFFEEYADWYEYLRQRKTYLDEAAFRRASGPAPEGLSTAYDELVSQLMANELLSGYLETYLAEAEGKASSNIPEAGPGDLVWTGKLRFMNQLIRALVKAKVLNNGNIPMSKVIAKFEPFFHVDLRNFYRASQENRITEDPQDFLKMLVEVHQKEVDDAADNPRYS
jgi:hypothetical protein